MGKFEVIVLEVPPLINIFPELLRRHHNYPGRLLGVPQHHQGPGVLVVVIGGDHRQPDQLGHPGGR